MSHNSAQKKEKDSSTILYVCRLLLFAAPLAILQLDFFLSAFLLIVMLFVPLWGEVLRSVLYVWAISIAIRQPSDVISLIFFGCAVIYAAEYVMKLVKWRSGEDGKE